MKRIKYVFVNIMAVLCLALLFGNIDAKAGGGEYQGTDFMGSAQRLRIGTTINTTYNHVKDEYEDYGDYYYFYLPQKMKVTIKESVSGSRGLYCQDLIGSDGWCKNEVWYDYSNWSYNPSNNKSSMKVSYTLPKGYYYLRIFNGKSINFSLGINASMVTSPAITSLKKSSGTSLTLKWGKVSGAVGYQVYRKIGSTGTYKKIKTTSNLSFKNTSLKKNKTYYYKVRAYRKVDGCVCYSPFSPAKKLTLK